MSLSYHSEVWECLEGDTEGPWKDLMAKYLATEAGRDAIRYAEYYLVYLSLRKGYLATVDMIIKGLPYEQEHIIRSANYFLFQTAVAMNYQEGIEYLCTIAPQHICLMLANNAYEGFRGRVQSEHYGIAALMVNLGGEYGDEDFMEGMFRAWNAQGVRLLYRRRSDRVVEGFIEYLRGHPREHVRRVFDKVWNDVKKGEKW